MSDSDDDDDVPVLVPITEGASSIAADGQSSSTDPPPPCPVTILSGFLGSGKTTLVQYILNNQDHGKKIAVIENEYGEGLQVESLIARDGSTSNNSNLTDLLELPNGCVCCTVKDSLVATLESLLDMRQDLDYILIECSGMANPGPLASLFWLDEGLSRLRYAERHSADLLYQLPPRSTLSKPLGDPSGSVTSPSYAPKLSLHHSQTFPCIS